tara:strand:- start:93 stop:422 length:330 start_codon:yes stop_codon:yes gene_type:complete
MTFYIYYLISEIFQSSIITIVGQILYSIISIVLICYLCYQLSIIFPSLKSFFKSKSEKEDLNALKELEKDKAESLKDTYGKKYSSPKDSKAGFVFKGEDPFYKNRKKNQ